MHCNQTYCRLFTVPPNHRGTVTCSGCSHLYLSALTNKTLHWSLSDFTLVGVHVGLEGEDLRVASCGSAVKIQACQNLHVSDPSCMHLHQILHPAGFFLRTLQGQVESKVAFISIKVGSNTLTTSVEFNKGFSKWKKHHTDDKTS